MTKARLGRILGVVGVVAAVAGGQALVGPARSAVPDGAGAGAPPVAPVVAAVAAGAVVELQVTGVAGVPADAAAVVLNTTVTNPTGPGYVTVYPCGVTRPLASNLNYTAGQTIPNLVIARVGAGGKVCLYTMVAADLVVDLSGYFPAGSGFAPTAEPTRVLDTREGRGAPRAKIAAGGTLELQIGGTAGVPSDAAAVVLNTTVTNPVGPGFVTAFPCGRTRPLASNLNYGTNATIPNLVIAKLGAGGKVCLSSLVATDVVADVSGYFPAGADYTPIADPTRILDTRVGTGAALARIAAGAVLELQVGGTAGVPADAPAVVLNTTVTNPAAAGFLTVYPCGVSRPLASNLNYAAGDTIPNLVIARLGTGGKVCLSSLVATDVVADVSGYFPAGADYVPIDQPTRLLDTRTAAAGEAPGAPNTPATGPPGGPGCALPSAAFCEPLDTFGSGGRSGGLSSARWSVGRFMGQTSNADALPFPATPVSACRAGVSQVVPPDDVLVCDAASGHGGQLLTALGAQNYGLLSMRPRQKFDFAGRTGKIVYDVDAVTEGGLSWWTSLYVTDEPYVGASDTEQVLGLLPRNGVGVNFDNTCGTTNASQVGVGDVFVFRGYAESKVANAASGCVATRRGSLNHVEVRLSQSTLEVWMTDYSNDGGATFGPLKRVFAGTVNLPFTQGYVHYQQAERAPEKYLGTFGVTVPYANNYWRAMGFDGPVVANETGYAVPDARTPNPGYKPGAINVGHLLAPTGTFTVPGVDTGGVTSAKLSFAVFFTYVNGTTTGTVRLQYRINGGPLRDPSPQPDYAASGVCTGCPGAGGGNGVLYSFGIPVSDLAPGTNTVTLSMSGIDTGWAPILSSLDLLTFR